VSTRERWYGALAGLAAAGVALGVAELVAVATGPRSAPMIAVGGLVIDLVPEPIKQMAIDIFGTWDKVALLVITGLMLALFAAAIGIAARRRLWWGLAGIGVFAAIGVVSALTRHEAGPAAGLPSVVGAACGGLALWSLSRLLPALPGKVRAEEPEEERLPERAGEGHADGAADVPEKDEPADRREEDEAADARGYEDAEEREYERTGRRAFLRGLGIVFGVAAVSGVVGRMWAGRRSVAKARETLTLPAAADSGAVAPAGADLNIPGLARYTTSNREFYRIDTALTVPQVDPAEWTLRIHGRVNNPMTLTFDDLLRRPMIERYVTLCCVSNEVGGDLIGNARWLGVPLKDLLDEADPQDGADQVVSRSVDGFTAGSPTDVLRDGRDALVAVAMNGEPLPVEHGFPARLVVPGLYGYVSATKWLAELELTSFADFDAYWIRRGWAAKAPIKTQSRIDVPRSGATIKAGPTVVAGVAWAQRRGISQVEVRVDDGEFQPATLAATVSIDTWRQWSYRWDATPGEHRLLVRATDNAGETQTKLIAPPEPDGATGYHEILVEVA
jgi:DMSO/TMAO reductase YedYZ molybdopterin-dependent catalytic subunit